MDQVNTTNPSIVVGYSPLMVETGERCEGVGEVIDEKEQSASDDDYGRSPPPMGDNSPRGGPLVLGLGGGVEDPPLLLVVAKGEANSQFLVVAPKSSVPHQYIVLEFASC
jgi:hypothetical protein